MIPSLEGDPFSSLFRAKVQKHSKGGPVWGEGTALRRALNAKSERWAQVLVSWLAGPEGHSSSVGPGVLICKMRALTASKSPSVQICGPRSCTGVAR